MREKIKLTENELRNIIEKTVRETLTPLIEGKGSYDDIEHLCDEMDAYAHEIQQEYYSHEKFFDNKPYAEHMGLDNVNMAVTYSLPYALDGNEDAKAQVQEDFDGDYRYFSALRWILECEGFGQNAMARGFSGSDPRSVMWVDSCKILRNLDNLANILGFNTKGLADQGIALARKAR